MYGSLSVAQFFLQLFLAHQKRIQDREKERKELLADESKLNNNDSAIADLNQEPAKDEKQRLIESNLNENIKEDKNLDKPLAKLDKPTPSSSQLSDYEMVRKIFFSSVKSWIRSSCFLGFNAFAMFSLFCFLRQITGRFYYSLVSVIPATVGCLMAIHIEKPTRRAALAVSVTFLCTSKPITTTNHMPLSRSQTMISRTKF